MLRLTDLGEDEERGLRVRDTVIDSYVPTRKRKVFSTTFFTHVPILHPVHLQVMFLELTDPFCLLQHSW